MSCLRDYTALWPYGCSDHAWYIHEMQLTKRNSWKFGLSKYGFDDVASHVVLLTALRVLSKYMMAIVSWWDSDGPVPVRTDICFGSTGESVEPTISSTRASRHCIYFSSVVVYSTHFHAHNPAKTLTPLKYWMLTQRDQLSTIYLVQSPLVKANGKAVERVPNMASDLWRDILFLDFREISRSTRCMLVRMDR